MRKLNNKGFAIASILYSVMVLFLILLLSILGILGSRKAILDKNKKDIVGDLNSALENNKFIFEHRDITIINNGNIDDIRFALMDGVSAVNKVGEPIGQEYIEYQGIDFNNIENNREYSVVYTANNGGNTITGSRIVKFVNTPDIKLFDYTGNSQTFTPTKNGSYKVELWGASGGAPSTEDCEQGKGAYVAGNIGLNLDVSMYIYIGENPTYTSGSCYDTNPNNSFNGSTSGSCAGGGGATDIRLVPGIWNNFESLKSRVMIAAGGGGVIYSGIGGFGGSLTGGDGVGTSGNNNHYVGTGATQTSFNFGNSPKATTTGGGGYYAGNAGFGGNSGGGSSFISGYLGCDAIAEESTASNIIHTGQPNHYSGYVFKNGVMRSGNDEMPTHDGTGTMIGNSGNGYAKISLIYYYE